MTSQIKNYIATDQNGKIVIVSGYTESEARQKAEEELGYGNVVKFESM